MTIGEQRLRDSPLGRALEDYKARHKPLSDNIKEEEKDKNKDELRTSG
jgi:hypothetical protein